MAGVVKVGPWGAADGTPRDISSCSKPQRLESITICSAELQGGRIYGFTFVYVDQRGEPITVGTWGINTDIVKPPVPFGIVPTINPLEKTIKMNPGEHVNHLSGTADKNGVTSLKLVTNQTEYGPYGCPAGIAFGVPLQQGNGEVISFFGRSGDSLKAIGVHVPALKCPVKVGPWGGYGGAPRDINVIDSKPEQLESVTVRSTESVGGRIYGFSFTYIDPDGQSHRIGPWGSKTKGKPHTFSLNDDEHVNHISGTNDDYGVTSLKFATNRGVYGPFGCQPGGSSGAAFSLPLQQGNGAAVSFFGSSGDTLVAFGAYVKAQNPNP